MQKSTILYVEDDAEIQKHFTEFLSRYCKEVYTAQSAEEGYALYLEKNPDIAMLDINLPGMNGLELAQKIRANNKITRILISTAYTDKEFLLRAVELELTRYLVKPITSEELLGALDKSLLELAQLHDKYNQIELDEGFSYDRKNKILTRNGGEITLRRKEMELLEFFIEHEGETITYEILESSIWQDEFMSKDAIRSQIKNLRKKTYPHIIKNITGIGYRFKKES